MSQEEAGTVRGSTRLDSIDAYRGLAMFLMTAEVLRLAETAKLNPGSQFWSALAEQQTHVPWAGGVLHDMIQPSFSFLVGVALPFSIATRSARGESRATMTSHALVRAAILILLGVFLRSMDKPVTNWTFEDTLSQIGLGYPFLFLLAWTSFRTQAIALGAILVGYWGLFAAYGLPDAPLDPAASGVPADWPHRFQGFAAHWNKESNPARAFDAWFLNLFSRESPFAFNRGGYATLSFIPTLGTMILGLFAGRELRSERPPTSKSLRLTLAGVIVFAAGWILHVAGVCPIVKRIWTPSWTLASGGLCFLTLAVFHQVMDVQGWKSWAFPLRMFGVNSIAAYVLAHVAEDFIISSFHTHLGRDAFRILGSSYEPFIQGVVVLSVLWLVLFWMYRRRIFLKV